MNIKRIVKTWGIGPILLILASMLLTQCAPFGSVDEPTPIIPTDVPGRTQQATARPATASPTATDEPTPGFQFNVFRETPNVGVGQSEPLPTMSNAGPASLPEGHRVSTDLNGEALLQGEIDGQQCSIFVFNNGSLTKGPCPASSAVGNISCQTGSVAYRDCDALLIQTPSLEAFQVGSWSWITYLEKEQLTVVLTSDGRTVVRPVLDAREWALDEEMVVPAGSWYYTAPDDMLNVVPGVPPRDARTWDEVPALLNQYPQLMPWMERALAHARQDDVPFPDPDSFEPTLVPGPDLVIELEVLGPAESIPEGILGDQSYWGIPVLAHVLNRGDHPAGIFKIDIFGTDRDGFEFLYPFAVQGQESLWAPYTQAPLPPGERIEFQGWVLLNPEIAPDFLTLQATVDGCAGEEFPPPFCRVEEYDEENNRSNPVDVVVR